MTAPLRFRRLSGCGVAAAAVSTVDQAHPVQTRAYPLGSN